MKRSMFKMATAIIDCHHRQCGYADQRRSLRTH